MFNHESPRPLPYVSQKIAYAAAAVSIGLRNTREKDERGLPLLQNGIVTLEISIAISASPAIMSKPCMRCCNATPPTIT